MTDPRFHASGLADGLLHRGLSRTRDHNERPRGLLVLERVLGGLSHFVSGYYSTWLVSPVSRVVPLPNYRLFHGLEMYKWDKRG